MYNIYCVVIFLAKLLLKTFLIVLPMNEQKVCFLSGIKWMNQEMMSTEMNDNHTTHREESEIKSVPSTTKKKGYILVNYFIVK